MLVEPGEGLTVMTWNTGLTSFGLQEHDTNLRRAKPTSISWNLLWYCCNWQPRSRKPRRTGNNLESNHSQSFSSERTTPHLATGPIKYPPNQSKDNFLSACTLTCWNVLLLLLLIATISLANQTLLLTLFHAHNLSPTHVPLVATRFFSARRNSGLIPFSARVTNSYPAWYPGCPPNNGRKARHSQSCSDNS